MNLRLTRNIICIMVFIAMIIFLFTKAGLASYTHDESFTYHHYLDDSFMDILSMAQWYPNNHILNTLLTKYSRLLFGTSELALRLPNLIAFCLYGIYLLRLLKPLQTLTSTVTFCLLITIPCVTDLFMLSRGYGLSICFGMIGLYYLFKAIVSTKIRHIVFFHIAMLLATLSNFTLLAVYIAELSIIIVFSFKFKHLLSKQNLITNITCILLSIGVLFEPVRRVTKNNLDFGGKSGFYEDTVFSIIENILQGVTLNLGILISISALITIALAAATFKAIKNTFKNETLTPGAVYTFVPLLTILLILGQHLVFGNDFPKGRFAYFLIPYSLLPIAFLINRVMLTRKWSKWLFLAPALFVCFISVKNFNLLQASEWYYEKETQNVVNVITKEKPNKDSVTVGCNWLFEPTINFYRKTNKLNWMPKVIKGPPTLEHDFIYLIKTDSFEHWDKYTPIRRFEEIHTILLKKKGL